MKKKNSSNSGVALLMSLAILALLSVVGIAFATNMRLMERTTRDFVYEVQARYLAEGGIEYAVARLKNIARGSFVFNGVNPSAADKDMLDVSTLVLPQGVDLTVKVIDTARQININNANADLLKCLPGNIGQPDADSIVSTRNTILNGKYLTKKSICLSSVGTVTYDAIKGYICTDTYIDPNAQTNVAGASSPRSALNINTLVDNPNSETMIRKILDAVPGFGSGHDSNNVTNTLNALRGNLNKPIKSWQEFNSLIDGAGVAAGGGHTAAEMKGFIKNTFNPNRVKPDTGYPTEFCFHSGGTYEITATGTVTNGAATPQTLATKQISATVKIFDLWNMTTKAQFKLADYNDPGIDGFLGDTGWNDGVIARVNWYDSCPVRSDQNWNNPSDCEKIPDSLKLGYWDDFNEDQVYSVMQWSTDGSSNNANRWNNRLNTTYFSGGKLNLPAGGRVYLWSIGRWYFYPGISNNSITLTETDTVEPTGNTPKEAGILNFRYGGPPSDFVDSISLQKFNNTNPPPGTCEQVQRYFKISDGNNVAIPDETTPGYHNTYSAQKVFRIIQRDGATSVITCLLDNIPPLDTTSVVSVGFQDPYSYSRYLTQGQIALESPSNGGTTWDNIRIIYQNGFYICEPIILPEIVKWGTIWGTITYPSTALESENKIAFQTRSYVVDDWNPWQWQPQVGEFEVNNQLHPGDPIPPTTQNSNTIQYRANFVTTNSNYLETPVLEDVWITYLPKTKILYWKEN